MRKVILILGKTGSGKSFMTKQLIERSTRTLVLDPMHEYTGTIFFSFEELLDYVESHNLYDSGSMRLVFRPTSDIDRDFLLKLASKMSNFLLVVEEAELYINPRAPNEHFLWMVNYGRHRNISLLCIARRVPEINIAFRAMITTAASFKQVEPNDIEHLEQYGFPHGTVENLDFARHEYAFIEQSPDEIEFT